MGAAREALRRVALDGWVGVRLEDIQSVTRFPVEDCFEIKALQAREQWPPRPPDGMALEGTEDLLRTAKHQGPMVSVFREFERPNVCWIGSVRKIEGDTVSLLEVNVAGGWARKPRLFDLDDITRIEFGGGYEEALGLVAWCSRLNDCMFCSGDSSPVACAHSGRSASLTSTP